MKDLSKLFKTIIDFKGLLFLVTKQSTIKTLRLLFFLPWLVQNTRFCAEYWCDSNMFIFKTERTYQFIEEWESCDNLLLDFERGDGSSVTASVGTEHGHVTTLHLFQAFKLGHSFVTWQQISLLLNTAIFFHIEFLNWVFEIHVFSELYGNRDGFTAGYLEESLASMQKPTR